MGRAAAQVPALMVRVTVVAVLIPVSRGRGIRANKAIKVVFINNLVRGLSSSNLVIKVIRSN